MESRYILRQLIIILRKFFSRIKEAGFESAFIYLKYIFFNTLVTISNKLCHKRRECPCCNWQGYRFLYLDCGNILIPEVYCPQCWSHERHRLIHLYLIKFHQEFFVTRGKVLHFAPEGQLRSIILKNPHLSILSADYAFDIAKRFGGVSVQIDLQNLSIKENSFDFIFCLHVLEHIPDDQAAISEIYRVLKPQGTAYIMVPFLMDGEQTIEFGKPDILIFDHVRGYSKHDFENRLKCFKYQKILPETFLTKDERIKYAIPDKEIIFRCYKD